ncbi:Retrotransposon-derived protein PEG10 [Rhizoctonia solani]|uniref:Retrotransposon-derived protein PEG10 n=1 Tax=Rhizoctonia solani TaxID=456999 RepID=A0A8H8ST42_9AGAM|nr:Retrotransposon-derived protein PEG10 [Rhizoctonia solani]QRW15688.1 Retrotransposon-derived protein PEG10 [Rhizoctonia solani]
MEPEPSLAALLEAVTALTATVRSLQDQIRTQGQQLVELKAICKETADLIGNKDQGAPQTKPGPSTGPHATTCTGHVTVSRTPVTPPTHTGGEAHTPGTVRPGLKAPFRPSRGTGFDSEEEEPRHAPKRSLAARLGALAPSPPSTQGKGNPPTTILALTAKFKEAFADPDAKRAAARKIAALTQTNTMSELEPGGIIAQFTCSLHWKVKELLSSKDNIPDDNLEAIFAASIKIDNTCWENEENRPKKQGTKSLVTATTSTTTQRVRLLEDPNYVTPEERDRCRASGLCVKCGQMGHSIKQCPNGWKATIKEAGKIGQDKLEKE